MKTTSKILLFLFVVFILAACSVEHMLYVPTTPEERAQVAVMEAQLLRNIPGVLSGHDQDWDDAIRAAHDIACKTICEPTLWEYNGFKGHYTGKWRRLNTGHE